MRNRLIKKVFAAVLSAAMVLNINFVPVNAESVAVKNVYTNMQKATMAIGTTKQIKAYTEPEDATNQALTYESSDSKVAKVSSSGLITAVAPGKAEITVTSVGNDKAYEKITVTVLKDLVINEKNLDSDGEVIILDGAYGNVTIDNSVGDADIYLSSVQIINKLVLEKGEYKVYMIEASTDSVEVKESVDEIVSLAEGASNSVPGLFVYDDSKVNSVNSTAGLNLTQDNTSSVATLTYDYSGDSNIDLNLEGFTGNLVINVTGKGNVNLNALASNIGNVTVTGTEGSGTVGLNNKKDSTIGNLDMSGSAKVDLKVPTDTLNIDDEAKKTKLTVAAPVKNLNNNGADSNIGIAAAVENLASNGKGAVVDLQKGGSIKEKEVKEDAKVTDSTAPVVGGGGGGGVAVPIPDGDGGAVLDANFENGNIDAKLVNKGTNVKFEIVDGGKDSKKSLFVYKRGGNAEGIAFELSPYTPEISGKQITFTIQADMKYVEGADTATVSATVFDGETRNINVTAKKNEWVTLTGDYKVSGSNPLLYFVVNNTSNYYIDNIKITIKEAVDNVKAESITVDQSAVTLGIGQTVKIIPTVLPAETFKKNVIWLSSDPSVATVDGNGVVTAKKGGTAKIDAIVQYGGMKASTTITVDANIKIYNLTLDKETAKVVGAGKEVQLKASATLNTSPITETVSWSSSNAAVATVDQTGKVTTVDSGSTVITASMTVKVDGKDVVYSDSCKITVYSSHTILAVDFEDGTKGDLVATLNQNMKIVDYGQNNSEKSLQVVSANRPWNEPGFDLLPYKGKNIVIMAYVKQEAHEGEKVGVTMQFAAGGATEYSNNSQDASADWAKIVYEKNLPAGTTNARIWFERIGGTIEKFYVDNVLIFEGTLEEAEAEYLKLYPVDTTPPKPKEVKGVSLSKEAMTLTVGGKDALKASISPLDATNPGLTWTSSDESIVTVDQDGNVTGVAEGKATITVTTGTDEISTVSFSATCEVEVKSSFTILSVNFEDGTKGALSGTLGTGLDIVDYGHNKSSKSLKITTATCGWGNPGFDLLPYKGMNVVIIAHMKQEGAEGQRIGGTIQFKKTGDASESYPGDSKNATAGWTKFIIEKELPADTTRAYVFFEKSYQQNVDVMYLDNLLIFAGTREQAEAEYARLYPVDDAPEEEKPITGITLDKTEIKDMPVGNTSTLKASIAPISAFNPGLTWESSNTAVATVDTNGVVTAVATGSAIITVKNKTGGVSTTEYSATCTVNVVDKVVKKADIQLTAANVDIGKESVVISDSGIFTATTNFSLKLPETIPVGTTITIHIKGNSVGNFRVYLLNGANDNNMAKVVFNANVDGGFTTGSYDLTFSLKAEVGSFNQLFFKAPYGGVLDNLTVTSVSVEY